jgi:AraC-like DNA-binding protein
LYETLEFKRIATDNFGLLIHFYYFQFEEPIQYQLEKNTENTKEKEQFVLRLINASAGQQVKFYKDTTVKGVSIYLDNKWIKQNLSKGIIDIIQYVEKINYLKENIHSRYQKLLFEIININENHPYRMVYIKARVLRLMDVLFENLLKKDITEIPERVSEQDFAMIEKVEKVLREKFAQPFPSIERLAKISLMSESKLKKLFKQSFGMGMYEYYQQNRLHKAKEMILLNKHTITEVGKMLGYQNLSNFSVAFKKEFNCLPSEISSLN